jgi:hypothetical protein
LKRDRFGGAQPEEANPRALFGGARFWSVSAGVRLFLGSAGPMRMGSYGCWTT